MSKILMLNGPNLNTLGTRKPEIYGRTTLKEVEALVEKEISKKNWTVISYQSNIEGQLVDALQKYKDTAGAVINPGALMIGGWSLRDALEDYPSPWIEVHISNIWNRETFRHNSILSPLASGVICGMGVLGYVLGARALCTLATDNENNKEILL
jgi:5-deoxy-5-amino-3-dehydroquinate dehydratase